MALETEPDSKLITLAIGIVSAYVSHNSVPAGELPTLIQSVYDQLAKLGQSAEPEPERLTPPIPIRKTVTRDHIISLEDGKPYKSLKRHLSARGITPEQYREKWGLPPTYPIVAESYAEQRSELAKSYGLRRRDATASSK